MFSLTGLSRTQISVTAVTIAVVLVLSGTVSTSEIARAKLKQGKSTALAFLKIKGVSLSIGLKAGKSVFVQIDRLTLAA